MSGVMNRVRSLAGLGEQGYSPFYREAGVTGAPVPTSESSFAVDETQVGVSSVAAEWQAYLYACAVSGEAPIQNPFPSAPDLGRTSITGAIAEQPEPQQEVAPTAIVPVPRVPARDMIGAQKVVLSGNYL